MFQRTRMAVVVHYSLCPSWSFVVACGRRMLSGRLKTDSLGLSRHAGVGYFVLHFTDKIEGHEPDNKSGPQIGPVQVRGLT